MNDGRSQKSIALFHVYRGRPPAVGCRIHSAAFTLIELFVVVAVLSILALTVIPALLTYQTRAKTAASKNNLRVLANAIETYHIDHGAYPAPATSAGDPYGVVASGALRSLTTPIAYLSHDAFRDPFGNVKVQLPLMRGYSSFSAIDDPFRPPTPGFNIDQSMLYFHYSWLASMFSDPVPPGGAFAVVSVGPDLKDSFIVFYPFPRSLPGRSGLYGIRSVYDSVYDPTNGIVSGGDLAAFGGALPVPRLVGGGD